MRHVLLLAVSTIALSSAPLGQASAGAGVSLSNEANALRLVQPVARVCREVCRDNFCRTRCFEERDRDELVRERFHRDHDRDYRDRDHRRGFELDAPGVSIHAR